MSDNLIITIAILAVPAAFVAMAWLSRRAAARRRAWIEHITGSFDAADPGSTDRSERRSFRLAEREFELSDAYRGGGFGSTTSGARYVTLRTPLAGHAWDLHSVTITERRESGTFDERVTVKESGLPLRDGWLSDRTRGAILGAFDLQVPRGEFLIEEGSLSYRTMASITKIDETTFRALVERLGALGDSLERGVH